MHIMYIYQISFYSNLSLLGYTKTIDSVEISSELSYLGMRNILIVQIKFLKYLINIAFIGYFKLIISVKPFQ